MREREREHGQRGGNQKGNKIRTKNLIASENVLSPGVRAELRQKCIVQYHGLTVTEFLQLVFCILCTFLYFFLCAALDCALPSILKLWQEQGWAAACTWVEWTCCKVMRDERSSWLQHSRAEWRPADGEKDGAKEEERTVCSWSISLRFESSMETAGEEKIPCHHSLIPGINTCVSTNIPGQL